MRSYLEEINPGKAVKLLKTVKDNRSLSQIYVEILAKDMADGRWMTTPQGIILDDKGNLLDGQHRLAAVVRSGATITFWVTEGAPREVFRLLDSGRMRTMSDRLQIDGYENTTQLAAVARKVYFWKNGQPWHARVQPTRGELQEVIDAEPLLTSAAHLAHGWHAKPAPATAAFGWWMFTKIDADAATWFMEGLRSGAGLEHGSPILTLRERLITETRAGKYVKQPLVSAWMILSWNAYREGRELVKLMFKNPLSNSNYPLPK